MEVVCNRQRSPSTLPFETVYILHSLVHERSARPIMTSFDLSLAELTARAYARATPAKKVCLLSMELKQSLTNQWARLVDKWFDERQTTSEERQDELAGK